MWNTKKSAEMIGSRRYCLILCQNRTEPRTFQDVLLLSYFCPGGTVLQIPEVRTEVSPTLQEKRRKWALRKMRMPPSWILKRLKSGKSKWLFTSGKSIVRFLEFAVLATAETPTFFSFIIILFLFFRKYFLVCWICLSRGIWTNKPVNIEVQRHGERTWPVRSTLNYIQ